MIHPKPKTSLKSIRILPSDSSIACRYFPSPAGTSCCLQIFPVACRYFPSPAGASRGLQVLTVTCRYFPLPAGTSCLLISMAGQMTGEAGTSCLLISMAGQMTGEAGTSCLLISTAGQMTGVVEKLIHWFFYYKSPYKCIVPA